MAKKIEIYENTLLKLLVRRGTDADRKNVTLSEGELGYTVDTKKLYIGDGQTLGGVPTGGVNFLGTYSLPYNQYPTTFLGDLIFAGANNTLFTFIGPDWREQTSWKAIGGIYTSGNNTISIDPYTNQIKVGALSANNISLNALGSGLTLDNLKKVTLSNTIRVDEIAPRNFDKISIPQKFNYKIGDGYSSDFILPEGGPSGFLYSDTGGNMEWRDGTGGSTLFVSGSAIVPVGTITPFPSTNNIPNGWLACNGQTVALSEYPVLGQVLGATNPTFKVPDLINKTLYGTSTPQTSTEYQLASSISEVTLLSAKGVFYIIKAKPDHVTEVDMEVKYPLIATVNGVEQNSNQAFSPLEGSVKIELDTSSSLGFKNKVINGNFDFWQRRTQTLNIPVSNIPVFTSNGTRTNMTADRWYTYAYGLSNSKGTFSVTREHNNQINFPYLYEGEDGTFQLNGNYFMRLKYDGGVGTLNTGTAIYNSLSNAGGNLAMQGIENASEVLGKQVTLSFWARASQNTYIFAESQVHSTERAMWTPATTSPLMLLTPEWKFFTHTYTIPTFRQVSAVAYDPAEFLTNDIVTTARPNYTPLGSQGLLPALSSWTYQVDIKTHWSRGTQILHGQSISATSTGFNYYYPGSGTPLDYPIGEFMTMPVLSTLCTNVLSGSPNGGYYDIAQVQLEVGKGATPFEHRPKQIELALCQRYFEKNYDVDTPPGAVNSTTWIHQFGNYCPTAPSVGFHVSFPVTFKVTKRAAPPIIQLYSPSTGLTGRFHKATSTTSPFTPIDVAVVVGPSNSNGFHTGGITVGTFGNHYLNWAAEAEI